MKEKRYNITLSDLAKEAKRYGKDGEFFPKNSKNYVKGKSKLVLLVGGDDKTKLLVEEALIKYGLLRGIDFMCGKERYGEKKWGDDYYYLMLDEINPVQDKY